VKVSALAAATLAAASAAPAPTPVQVARAVARATHSRTLWATVNVCRSHRGVIGIRGQMPALGFPARLTMTVRVRYWDASKRRFEPVPRVAKLLRLGTVSHGTVQDGVEYTFAARARLAGSITFAWYRRGKLIGTATRATRGGVSGVADSQPRGYSAATCRIS
jgi:hypothetical protein